MPVIGFRVRHSKRHDRNPHRRSLREFFLKQWLRQIEAQVAVLGPALQGSVKKNRNRRVRKDGSVYVSPEHYTFVYRDGAGQERWKRIAAAHLPTIMRMKKAGGSYKKLMHEHARLTTALGIASLGKKKTNPEATPP